MKPPADLAPADLWAQITAMPRAHRIVPFPRRGPDGQPMGNVAMQVLYQAETQSATVCTENRVRRALKASEAMPGSGEPRQSYEILFETWASCETLYRCCRKADDISKPFFLTVEEIAAKLSSDEIACLLLAYNQVRAELGPIVSEMSQEEMDAWIEMLAKGGSTVPLASLSLGAQSRLVLYMASLLYLSPTDSSLPGSPLAALT